jgi:hypothetical protein
VFDGVDLNVALGQGCGAIGFGDVFDTRLDFRFAFEVHAPETDAGPRGRRESHVHAVAAVQTGAGKTRRSIERLLL